MNVDGVRNGIVLDHIAAGKSMENTDCLIWTGCHAA